MKIKDWVIDFKKGKTTDYFNQSLSTCYLNEVENHKTDAPKWYGIDDVYFIYGGSETNSLIIYNDIICPSYIVEDTMIERFNDELNNEIDSPLFGKEYSDDLFSHYMLTNKDMVIECIMLTDNN